jgi:hypothetical protein
MPPKALPPSMAMLQLLMNFLIQLATAVIGLLGDLSRDWRAGGGGPGPPGGGGFGGGRGPGPPGPGGCGGGGGTFGGGGGTGWKQYGR